MLPSYPKEDVGALGLWPVSHKFGRPEQNHQPALAVRVLLWDPGRVCVEAGLVLILGSHTVGHNWMMWGSIPLYPFNASPEVYVSTEKEIVRALEQDVKSVVSLTVPCPMPFLFSLTQLPARMPLLLLSFPHTILNLEPRVQCSHRVTERVILRMSVWTSQNCRARISLCGEKKSAGAWSSERALASSP